ncbi:EAL domain-containing protein (putative c-di-GMP-specific phosphodiesterase class I) [Alkalibacillus filiformis]|uniref:EAL domain-containing protein (Putative c-di-GMP-specific phosphodiesterase class I) n=1 Tax=Alkalibacillus filiformis TaxID=200990 RepID=A0ABU0DV96_9BACI|nr:EAL domain-containing protein [Alkalibacillus filiformis]MDQ0352280.1 EAL domain-containing protein (putative c-di-GMP-specific phosphodiesterase class I) [Alkalibacillus filiformis]
MSNKRVKQLIEGKNFFHVFQPIHNLIEKRIIGYEALFRSQLFDAPEQAFRSADSYDQLFELDKLSVTNAVKYFSNFRLEGGELLYINVFPSTVGRPEFVPFIIDLVDSTSLRRGQVVIELVELEAIKSLDDLKYNTRNLKDSGFKLSIDDVGKGSSSFRLMIELEPQIVKIDQYFIRELPHSTLKQKMIESLVGYCYETETDFILEGIETARELEVAKQLGVRKGQGYYLGEPAPLEVKS